MKWKAAIAASKSEIAVRGDPEGKWMWVGADGEGRDWPGDSVLTNMERDRYDDWRPTDRHDDAVTLLGDLA